MVRGVRNNFPVACRDKRWHGGCSVSRAGLIGPKGKKMFPTSLPSPIAAFATPVFTAPVTIILLIQCAFLVSACMVLWTLARPDAGSMPAARLAEERRKA